VRFWSTITATRVLTSAFAAAAAAAIVISGQRSVLTTGVMIALALIPSLTITGLAAVVGDLPLTGRGVARWAVDVVLVMAFSAVVIGIKRLYLQKHRALS
jgi:uncharacterized membrane protein